MVSVVAGGVTAVLPTITTLAASPTATEFLLTYTADPGAYFTLTLASD